MRGAWAWRGTALGGVPAADLAAGLVLMVVAVATTVEMDPPEGPPALTLPVAVVMTAAVAWRTRATLASVVAIVVASEVQATLATSPGTVWSLAVFLVAAYSAARCCTEGRASVGGALVIGVLMLQELQDGDGGDYVFVALVFGGTWLLGRAVRRWQERATVAEQNQELLARNAVAEERVRIARELHDVIAHSVSVVSVQANAAEAALEHDPRLAREPLRAIKQSSREALEEMRRLLVLLRADEPDATRARPQPGVGDLDSLFESVRTAGLPLAVVEQGEVPHLAPGVDLSAYRILQEALTNVLKHAGPVPTTVEICYRGDEMTMTVVNPVPAAAPVTADSGGHGLVGIRERVGVLGGDMRAGLDDHAHRYVVRVRLPYRAER